MHDFHQNKVKPYWAWVLVQWTIFLGLIEASSKGLFCYLLEIRLKKKNSGSQSCRPHLFFCAHLILQNSDFHFFFLEIIFFFIFTTKNEESLLFWKNISTWELKKRVKSPLISENMEVETFQSFLVSDVRGGKGQLK